ncbi:MAG: hypothetical protein D3906_13815 [Candidatus Electrothrix sp. AUS1_2]|nr:hypothetical protein [Candidatus Electrothrix sp. AUS1_2]
MLCGSGADVPHHPVGAKNFSPLQQNGTSKTIGSMVRRFKIGVTKWMRRWMRRSSATKPNCTASANHAPTYCTFHLPAKSRCLEREKVPETENIQRVSC